MKVYGVFFTDNRLFKLFATYDQAQQIFIHDIDAIDKFYIQEIDVHDEDEKQLLEILSRLSVAESQIKLIQHQLETLHNA